MYVCTCTSVHACVCICVCVCLCVCVYHTTHVEVRGQLWESTLSLWSLRTKPKLSDILVSAFTQSHLASPLVTYFHTGIIKVISSDRTVSFKAPWPQIHGALSLLKCIETVLSTSGFNSLSSQNWRTRITSRHSGDWHGWLTGFRPEEVGFLISNLDRPLCSLHSIFNDPVTRWPHTAHCLGFALSVILSIFCGPRIWGLSFAPINQQVDCAFHCLKTLKFMRNLHSFHVFCTSHPYTPSEKY